MPGVGADYALVLKEFKIGSEKVLETVLNVHGELHEKHL